MLTIAVSVEAQFGRRGRGFRNVRVSKPEDQTANFQFCRIAFNSDFRGDGGSWEVDYPRADINLSIRLAELTKTPIAKIDGEPAVLLMQLTDDVLFQCPFIMMTEVGNAALSEPEVQRLREYLLKGGFLWADDFWGSYAWEWWEAQLQRVLPPSEYPIIDLEADHPLYSSQFKINGTPQIASINHWAGSGGGTSERGEDSAVVNTRAVLNRYGTIMVLMTHNTDVGDSFEREADDPQYFLKMSVPGYAFGVNALLYALTH